MAFRTPTQIAKFVEAQQHRMDQPVQYMGNEPNAYGKPWESTTTRWCLVASWPYIAAAGNQSIPAVYKSINDGREDFLCDRFYLPETPRDLKIFEEAGYPVFGIESKHQLRDFDVVATSIAYPLLSMSFWKMLKMSDIPPRWKEREAKGLENFPFIMVGGQAYGAPEVMSPIVDAWWCGEVEEEPGNPGIATVTERISDLKASGLWSTNRLACYEALAREFNFLYFPRFVEVNYAYEDRAHVGAALPSKQVISYVSKLEGMKMPFVKRIVKNLDNVEPLTNPPLLFADPAMGCLARTGVVITQDGPRCVEDLWIDQHRVAQPLSVSVARKGLHPVHAVVDSGDRYVVRIRTKSGHEFTATPDHLVRVKQGPLVNVQGRRFRRVPLGDREFDQTRDSHDTLDQLGGVWVEAQDLNSEYLVPLYYGQDQWALEYVPLDSDCPLYEPREGSGRRTIQVGLPASLTEDVAYFLGLLASDGWLNRSSVGIHTQLDQQELTDEVRRLLGELFSGVSVKQELPQGDRGVRRQFVTSKGVAWWLEENFGIVDLETRRARVYDKIFRSPRSVVSAFLSGVFDANGDASVAYEGTARQIRRSPRFSGGYQRFALDIASLINNLGAPTTVNREIARGRLPGVRQGHQWRVSVRDAEDGDYSWLQPRLPAKASRVRAWESRTTSGRSPRRNGVWFSPVESVERLVDLVQCYDVQVPGTNSFTCDGMEVHNSGDLEVARGCPAWCSFCALTYRQKPYRQRSVSYMVDYAKKFRDNIGSVELSPFSPDFPMFTQRKKLIKELLENVSDEVDAGAMRVDDFIADSDFILLQVHGGLEAVTLGLEGNSQRMRDLVGKGTADEDVKEAVARGIRAGIKKFKLFMISNLPGEDEGDIFRILKLAKDLADIRDNMNQPHVIIQFSWTPLLIEANTPFQWFAIPGGSRALGDMWEQLRDLKISFKIGAKAEPNKAAFFQLCQRASREVGEALVDVMEVLDKACWGGVPKHTYGLLEEALRARGFHNAFADCFEERFKNDMFGWEFVDQGISSELLWVTYLKMREFVEQTDSHTYDANFDDRYHGNEWITRCDERCLGKTCGVCDAEDLRIRRGYIVDAQSEIDVDLASLNSLDQRSVAFKVRARIFKPEAYRFVMNDHWRFNFRRACFRAQETLGMDASVAKRSIKFASDDITYKDWTCGTDYVEFGVTRRLTPVETQDFVDAINVELGDWMHVQEWKTHPVTSPTMRTDVDLSLWELELDEHPDAVEAKIQEWQSTTYVPMLLKKDGYFAPQAEEVNAKDYVRDFWLVRAAGKLKIRMLLRGQPSPYVVYAALMGKRSWLPVAKLPAVRIDAFIEVDDDQDDFFRPNCDRCDRVIPINILDEPYNEQYCPRCLDIVEGVEWATAQSLRRIS